VTNDLNGNGNENSKGYLTILIEHPKKNHKEESEYREFEGNGSKMFYECNDKNLHFEYSAHKMGIIVLIRGVKNLNNLFLKSPLNLKNNFNFLKYKTLENSWFVNSEKNEVWLKFESKNGVIFDLYNLYWNIIKFLFILIIIVLDKQAYSLISQYFFLSNIFLKMSFSNIAILILLSIFVSSNTSNILQQVRFEDFKGVFYKKDDYINVSYTYCQQNNVILAGEMSNLSLILVQRPKITTRGTKLTYSIKAKVTRTIKSGSVSMVNNKLNLDCKFKRNQLTNNEI
jgi:hypothetical protein